MGVEWREVFNEANFAVLLKSPIYSENTLSILSGHTQGGNFF